MLVDRLPHLLALLAIWGALSWTTAAAAEQTGNASGSTATLPLQQLLDLHDQTKTREAEPESPPFAATLSEAILAGRLLDEALDVTADFKVAVLGERWVRVPLMRLDRSVQVRSITGPEKGTVALDGDTLVLVTNEPGLHVVRVSLLGRAGIEGRRRRVELSVARAAVAALRVRFDADLFQLVSRSGLREPDEHLVYPEGGKFVLQWEARAAPAARAPVARPPVETVITSADASVVCTLDGLQLARVAYRIRLQGTQPIRFAIPRGNTVKKVFLNGAAIPFTVGGDGSLRVDVVAGRAGDESAGLELVLLGERREFHLSGRLAFAFPAASCNQNQLSVALHLPVVFDYAWSGGSLAPGGDTPEPAYAYEMPAPGKTLRFRQELISSSPDLQVEYRVDLKDQYFRAEDGGALAQGRGRE